MCKPQCHMKCLAIDELVMAVRAGLENVWAKLRQVYLLQALSLV